MCYLCEARGSVGPNYRATQRVITAALSAWRKGCGPLLNAQRGTALQPDMTKKPASIKVKKRCATLKR